MFPDVNRINIKGSVKDMKAALVLIDIQKDYFPGGSHPLFQPEAAAGRAKALLEFFRQNGLDVYHIQHISTKANATFFRPDTEGIEIHPLVRPLDTELVFIKHFPDAFQETGLEHALRLKQIDTLVICGMMSHMCIDTSVRAAKRLMFNVLLAEDACTTSELTWHSTIIPATTVHQTMMASLDGSFAQCLSTEEILRQLANEQN
jgi:nicotinamidase-related amidase